MKNRIIMTIGTSLLASACWDIEGVDTYDGITDESIKRMTEANNRDTLEKKSEAELIAAFKSNVWEKMNPLRDLPAEMSTLRLLVEALNADQNTENHLKAGDEIFLLHSTKDDGDDDGSKCARVQIKLLRTLLPEGVIITPEPIKHLDPADKSKLQLALNQIWLFCKNKLENEPETKKYLNLTGGYKATSMLIATLASMIDANTSIVYGHESSDLIRDSLFVFNFDQRQLIDSRVRFGYFDDTNNEWIDLGAN